MRSASIGRKILSTGAATRAKSNRRLRFNRNELASAFGNIGTDLPLVTGIVLAARLDAASVLFVFGALQILTGVTTPLALGRVDDRIPAAPPLGFFLPDS